MELKGNPELIDAFRRGDRDVLTELYRSHVEAVAALLRHGFNFSSKGTSYRFRGFYEPHRLQESLQESFVHAFRPSARQSYDGTQSYRPYLLAIARNHLIDGFRRERLEASLFVPIAGLPHDGESEDEALGRVSRSTASIESPERHALQTELATILDAFVDDLSETEALILRLHLMGDLSQQEVAAELGTDRNHVRKEVRQLRGRLLRHLKSEGFISSLDEKAALALVTLVLCRGGLP
ncbi:MAG: RNA polymerase sigma factor [Bradymonadaceae bacterium]